MRVSKTGRHRRNTQSVDEKSKILALDRTQPGLPLTNGRCGTMTHNYIRNGTTTLFAALDVADGKVIDRCLQRHRHQEFVRFLKAIEAEMPKCKAVHAIVDNYATHKPVDRRRPDSRRRPCAAQQVDDGERRYRERRLGTNDGRRHPN